MGKKEEKIDYYKNKNFDVMNSLERNNAINELEKQADEFQQLEEIKSKMPEVKEEVKAKLSESKSNALTLAFKNILFGKT